MNILIFCLLVITLEAPRFKF